jgi:hypothetical protein
MAHTFREGEYRQGQHICLIYETPEDQLAVAAAYVADGLRAGERVLQVAESAAALHRFRARYWRRAVLAAPHLGLSELLTDQTLN